MIIALILYFSSITDTDIVTVAQADEKGWLPAVCILGDEQQKERDWVLGEFKAGSTSILLATDVAARGLDVDDVKLVINYD